MAPLPHKQQLQAARLPQLAAEPPAKQGSAGVGVAVGGVAVVLSALPDPAGIIDATLASSIVGKATGSEQPSGVVAKPAAEPLPAAAEQPAAAAAELAVDSTAEESLPTASGPAVTAVSGATAEAASAALTFTRDAAAAAETGQIYPRQSQEPTVATAEAQASSYECMNQDSLQGTISTGEAAPEEAGSTVPPLRPTSLVPSNRSGDVSEQASLSKFGLFAAGLVLAAVLLQHLLPQH